MGVRTNYGSSTSETYVVAQRLPRNEDTYILSSSVETAVPLRPRTGSQ